MALSNNQVVRLGNRLRDAKTPTEEDLAALSEVLTGYNDALDEVVRGLRSIGLEPTTRLKTSGTIIDKLRREGYFTLRSIRDLAGARVVQPMTLDQQDAIAAQIVDLWPGTRIVDRRASPSHGYRAVHLVPRIDGRPVEIQLRTMFQDTWAQLMESFGDAWGREVRYGGDPENPDQPITPTSEMTRRETVDQWKGMSETLNDLARAENQLARHRGQDIPPETQTKIEEQVRMINDQVRGVRGMVLDICGTLQRDRQQ